MAYKRKKKSLPSPTSNGFNDKVKEVIELREGVRSGNDHAFVTFGDLDDLDLAGAQTSSDDGGTTLPFDDGDPPQPPTNLTVDSGFFGNELTWTNSVSGDVWYYEIWVATSQDRSTASLLASVAYPRTRYFHTLNASEINTDHYYWMRAVDWSGLYSTWEPPDEQGGYYVPGQTSYDELTDNILDILVGEITESQLHADLTARINILDYIDNNLLDRVDQIRADLGDIQAFDSGSTYSKYALVHDSGTIYRCIQDILSTPAPDPTNTSYWESVGTYSEGAIEGVSANAFSISTLDSRVTTNEGDITANASDITALETTVNDPDTGVDANASAVSTLDTRVTSNEGDISTNASDITSLETTVNDPDTGVDANATAISTLDSRVTTNEGDITVNASSVDYVSASLSAASFRAGFEDSEFSTNWTIQTGNTLTQDTDCFSGIYAGLFTSTLTNPVSTGTTDCTYLTISENAALSFSGKRVRVSVYAKAPSSGAASEFALCYATNDVGNSGWQKFSLPSSWGAKKQFVYDVPEPTSGGNDFIGVWGDTSGVGNGVLLDNIVIEVIPDSADIDYDGSDSVATAIESLDTTVSSHDGDITDIKAEWLVKLNANGHIAGVGLMLDGLTGASIFEILADTFAVVNPGDESDPEKFPFIVGTVEGVSTVGINGQLMVDGSVYADAVGADQIKAIHLDANEAFVNTIQSSNYASGTSGWKIDHANDLAEFNDITITITAGTGATNLDDGPAEAGADVTANNQAASILNQGNLATLNSVDYESHVDNRPILKIAENTYDGSEDASQYSSSHKVGTLLMEISGTTHSWPTSFGGVVTYWFASDRAKQIVYDAGLDNNEEWIRYVRPNDYPTWTAWRRQEVFSSGDVDVLQAVNAPADAGATAGASWTTNLDSIPARLDTDAPTVSGLFLNDDYLGYYDGTSPYSSSGWQVFIASNGQFGFSGDGNNYITWDGVTLSVVGSITVGNPASVRTDINVADGADVTASNTANDTSNVNGVSSSTVQSRADIGFANKSFSGGSVSSWNKYISSNPKDFGLEFKIDKANKEVYFRHNGYATDGGTNDIRVEVEVQGAEVSTFTSISCQDAFTDVTRVTFDETSNSYGSNGFVLAEYVLDAGVDEVKMTLDVLDHTVAFRFKVTICGLPGYTFVAMGDRITHVGLAIPFETFFSPVDFYDYALEDGTTIISGGYLRTDIVKIDEFAYIENAVIQTAHIGNLQVATGKIADNAVTTVLSSTGTTSTSVTITVNSANDVVQIIGTATAQNGSTSEAPTQEQIKGDIEFNGAVQCTTYAMTPGPDQWATANPMFEHSPGVGTHTYKVVSSSLGNIDNDSTRIIVLHTRK